MEYHHQRYYHWYDGYWKGEPLVRELQVAEGHNETGKDALIGDNGSTLPAGDVLGFGALGQRRGVMKEGVDHGSVE